MFTLFPVYHNSLKSSVNHGYQLVATRRDSMTYVHNRLRVFSFSMQRDTIHAYAQATRFSTQLRHLTIVLQAQTTGISHLSTR